MNTPIDPANQRLEVTRKGGGDDERKPEAGAVQEHGWETSEFVKRGDAEDGGELGSDTRCPPGRERQAEDERRE